MRYRNHPAFRVYDWFAERQAQGLTGVRNLDSELNYTVDRSSQRDLK